MSEEALQGGNVGRPVRVDANVHREPGPWTPVVHALLRHLESAGFDGAPRVVGFDADGREVLTFIDGEPGSLGFPQALQQEAGLVAFGRFIRAFHDAAAGFVPPPDATYRAGERALAPGEIVCHGDLGHWNTIWQGEEIVGLIDWEFAEPGPPLRDVATAATACVPMLGDDFAARILPFPPDRRARLAALCAGYGAEPVAVVRAAVDNTELEMHRLRTFGAEGREPWSTFLAGGQLQLFERISAWIAEHHASLC